MAERQQADERSEGMGTALKRRGLIAAAAALGVGIAARQAQPVSAATNDGPLTIAQRNTASLSTVLVALNTFNQAAGAFVAGFDAAPAPGGGQSIAGVVGYGGGDNGNGVMGGGKGISFQGHLGDFAQGAGVLGRAISGYPGVYGISPAGYGVEGTSTSGTGVFGDSTSGTGVFGDSTSGTGVFGHSSSSSVDIAGVQGEANGGGSHGVRGVNYGTGSGVTGSVGGSGTGVRGVSVTGIGVYGVHSDTAGTGSPFGVVGAVTGLGFGVYGVVNTAGAVAFAGGAGVNGAIAAQFSGPVNVYHTSGTTNGNLYVQGNQTIAGTKSAAVPHPDGTHRLLYCVESPEAWFEDFGEGTITGGKAEVKLDADFAAVVDTSKLHVFCMPHDEHHHLAVKARGGGGFSVAATPSAIATALGTKASDVSGTFSYRVVAKRKDVAAPRLARFTVPQEVKAATPLVVPTIPKDEKKPTPPPVPTPPTVDNKG